jgi:hypothetical protein
MQVAMPILPGLDRIKTVLLVKGLGMLLWGMPRL